MGPAFPGIDSGTAASAAAHPAPRSERILFVDDEEALLFLGRKILGQLGYKVTTFEDPREALARFREEPDAFDAVVSDISMPSMSGFDLAEALLAVRPDLPVVITSGYVRPEDEERASRLAVRALIPKPNTVDEMAAALDRIFREALSSGLPDPARGA